MRMIPDVPHELLPYLVPASSLAGSFFHRTPLDRTHVFKFPNNRGLSITYNARGDVQIGQLLWESYRITSVKLADAPVICTSKLAKENLLRLFESYRVGELSEKEKVQHRRDLAALLHVGFEEKHAEMKKSMQDDDEFLMEPIDTHPSLDWAIASLNALPKYEQDELINTLPKPWEKMVCVNMLENALRISIRYALEAARADEACEFLGRIRDSHGILAYDDMLLEAANRDLVSGTKITKTLLQAIAKREDAYSMRDFLSYFSLCENKTTDVRYLVSVLSQADVQNMHVKGTREYNAEINAYVPRKQRDGGHADYLSRGYQSSSYRTFEGKPLPELSENAVDVTQLIASIQCAHGSSNIDPFARLGNTGSSASPYAKNDPESRRLALISQLQEMIMYCELQLEISENEEELSPLEQLIENFNSIGNLKGIVPTVSLVQLNSHLAETMQYSTASLRDKIEWYIDTACDIFIAGEMQYSPVNDILGGMSGWPDSLLASVKQELSRAWNNNIQPSGLSLS